MAEFPLEWPWGHGEELALYPESSRELGKDFFTEDWFGQICIMERSPWLQGGHRRQIGSVVLRCSGQLVAWKVEAGIRRSGGDVNIRTK